MRVTRAVTISVLAIALSAGWTVAAQDDAQPDAAGAPDDPWAYEWLSPDFTGFLFLGPDETGDDDNERFAQKGKGTVESMLLGVEFLDGRIVGPARFHSMHSKKAGTTWTVSTPTSEWRGVPVEPETRGLVSVLPRPHVLEGVNGTEGDLTFDSLFIQSNLDHIFRSVEPGATE
jgi:hypothetical protein